LQTYPLNALAEQFEVDRSTMVRAMRNVPPDLVKRGNRPTWKTSTAAKALEAHRRKSSGGNGTGPDPTLTAMFAKYDQLEAAMRALPTLEARRQAARDMAPFIAELDEASRRIGIRNGQDEELVHLRADAMYQLYLRGIEGPCEWTHEQAFEVMAGEFEDV
jgi:hypothetical protein